MTLACLLYPTMLVWLQQLLLMLLVPFSQTDQTFHKTVSVL